MQIDFRPGDPVQDDSDAVIVPVYTREESIDWSGVAAVIDERLSGHLRRLAEGARFAGQAAKTLLVPTLGQLGAQRVVLAGLGERERVSEETLTRAIGAGVQAARAAGAKAVTVVMPESGPALSMAAALQAATTGVALALYRFDDYRGAAAPASASGRELDSVTFVGTEDGAQAAKDAIARGRAIGDAVNLARDLTNEPGSALTPESFAARAQNVAAAGDLEIEVLGPDQLATLGAAATLAVGGGSVNGPRLIRMRYQPAEPADASIVPGLVGKAITFDTGGYSIKPYEAMLEMKGDMAGGAAVLGAMSALRELGCPTPVVAAICAAENMISGTAFRPGDVIKGMNGVTMEIISTDAEGRLVLADGLVDTARRGATELIDLATLTGAAVVALGEGTTALFASDDLLADRLLAAADESGERMWRMPLIDELERKIEGDVADIKNSGGRAGGAITAALFLRHFREGLPWAHLDIAGSARQDKSNAIGPKGATGVGVRTLLRYLTADGG